MAHFLNSTIIINMDIQSLRLMIHSAHRVRLEHTVLLGEIGLRERLWHTH
jgi:hypothetical protein